LDLNALVFYLFSHNIIHPNHAPEASQSSSSFKQRVAYLATLLNPKRNLRNEYLMTVYSHIIVGAGSAGCVLAKRLSADRRTNVLLIEAGMSDMSYLPIHVPIGYLACIGNERTDWMFATENEAMLRGRSLLYPRGLGLGGCSSINGMIYMRGQKEDYDGWAEVTGDDGWNWDNMLPLFKWFVFGGEQVSRYRWMLAGGQTTPELGRAGGFQKGGDRMWYTRDRRL